MTTTRARRMTAGESIDDWLNLVDPDGAFLSPGQLRAVFPQGFEPMPTEQRADLRAQVTDLDGTPAARAALRQWLLGNVLAWGDDLADGQRLPATAVVRAAEHGVQLRPVQALLDVDDANTMRLAVFVWPTGTRLDRRPDVATAGDTWAASPVQRAETWCRESGVPLALVTDDDHWVLVWGPRNAPSASCRWRIGDLADERILQAGYVSLLGARRFFAVPAAETIETLFREAADAEAEITKGLGMSVRRSVELLVAAISRDHVASDHAVLRGVASTELYEAAVTVLMRLVFLLFAEERRLLPAEDPLWAESYSVLTLRDDLRIAAIRDGDDALERRSTAWHRLLATFRAVHGGVNHDRLTLPAYGGNLFDPDRFAFLEGRRQHDHLTVSGLDTGLVDDDTSGPGRPVAIDDRTTLAILDALLTIEVKSGRTKVAQRVSYKALDVEQIGHCYEGLLDHGAVRIDGLSLGLVGSDGAEPEISINDLETRVAVGPGVLLEWLAEKERCSRTTAALAALLARQPEGVDLARLRVACGHDDATVARVLPFWGLIRNDLRGLPVVLLPGSQYVTQTSTRRNTGAQYTTKALAEEVAQYALEPLVYDPGPQNEADRDNWKLRTPAEILNLRVCDPAVGSGAILTAAGRYLADRLIQSVLAHGPGEGRFAGRLADLADAPAEDQVVLARREVVDHCLYGVDKNPVAAEMAKLSLWLTTMARERPFTFLDHAIQVGDSLLGITEIDQLRWLHLDPAQRKGAAGFESLALDARIKEATDLARLIQELSVITVRDAADKERLTDELRAKLADLAIVADAVVGAALSTAGKRGVMMEERLSTQLHRIRTALDDTSSQAERSAALETLESVATGWLRTDLPDEVPMPWERQCLHWPLAFPEVFLTPGRSGFDAVVGNPPFLGSSETSLANGVAYRDFLVDEVAGGVRGKADLVVFFVLRAALLAQSVSLITTNTISQGASREVGLDQLLKQGRVIARARTGVVWPGEASVSVTMLGLWRGGWETDRNLNGRAVRVISPLLEVERRVEGIPLALAGNRDSCWLGSKPRGEGFVITESDAREIIARSPSEKQILFPYLGGRELNDDPQQRSSRWIIDFGARSIDEASRFPHAFARIEKTVRPSRATVTIPAVRERWWLHEHPALAMYRAIAPLDQVVVMARVSRTVMPALVPNGQVFSEQLAVFRHSSMADLALLSSASHWAWAVTYGSTMRSDLRYNPSDLYETFPRPRSGQEWDRLGDAGRALTEFRAPLMVRTNLGLTKTYNRVHDPDEHDPSVVRLRELHVELDHAVSRAYGWSDLALDHHHWETPQGMRFTVSPTAKDELLDRLLELNHQRYAEEVAAGLHDSKAKKASARNAKAVGRDQGSLL
jgi:hypothetical protein